MSDERSYPEGVTCWVDTEQPDVDAARHFYATLFGWTFTDAVPADAPGTSPSRLRHATSRRQQLKGLAL